VEPGFLTDIPELWHYALLTYTVDFDYLGSRFHAAEGAVDALLASRALRDLLRVAGVEMSEPTKPKQTDTTRRWEFHVDRPDAHLNTKVEFSPGEVDPEHAFETARADLGRAIGLRVVMAEHYLPPAAIRQKIRALAQRHAAEPRDVFDLDLLLATYRDQVRPGEVDQAILQGAIDAALSIPYETYQDLVVQYIEDDFVAIYGRPEVWTDMTLGVVEHLESLR